MKVDGKALMLRVDGKTIALATDCMFEQNLETFDARTKDDGGASDVPGDITSTLSTDSLLGINEGKVQQTFATLESLFRAKRTIPFEVMLAADAADALLREDWAPGPARSKGFVGLSGEALITSLRLGGKTTGKATMSVQLRAQGELTPVTPLLEASMDGDTLTIDGSVEVFRGVLDLGDFDLNVNENILEL